MSCGVAGAPRGSKQERAREHGAGAPQYFFLVVSEAVSKLSQFVSLSPSKTAKKKKMSFAMTANFFYAVVVAGLAYNVFILYAGASAAKLALSK